MDHRRCLATTAGRALRAGQAQNPALIFQLLLPIFAGADRGRLGSPSEQLQAFSSSRFPEVTIKPMRGRKCSATSRPEACPTDGQLLSTRHTIRRQLRDLVDLLLFKPQV